MKQKIILTITLLLLTHAVTVHGAAFDYPVISDEYQCKEILFITGKPIEVSGTVKVTEGQSRGYTTIKSRYTLANAAEGIKLSRTVNLKITHDVREDIGQTVSVTVLDKYSEDITTPFGKYTLKDYILNGSRITHHKPIADFFSGNWQGRKVYSVNKKEGQQVIIDTLGEEIGYDHHWGNVVTCQVKGYVDAQMDMIAGDGITENVRWDGDFSYTLSSITDKYTSYIKNQPSQISFSGGYMLTEEKEGIIEYSYDLPRFDSDGMPRRRDREKGGGSLVSKTVPKYQRLLIPDLKDIGGHWAQTDIEVLNSLGVFPHTSAYFGPGLPMLRSDFARAIAEATGLLKDIGTKNGAPTQQPPRPQQQPQPTGAQPLQPNQQNGSMPGFFSDVSQNHPDYEYIIEVERRGIIQGVGLGKFAPDGVLTRAQAVTVMMRAIGFENMAPGPGFRTWFNDDSRIPDWAMDSVYAASEIGLIQGDTYGNLNPNEVLSRAEAAALLHRFIKYLQSDIKKDYRDRIFF